MKSVLRTLLAFTTIAFAGVAFAGEGDSMHVKIPFAFKAGKTELPAGDYVVSEEESGIIMIRGNKGNAMLLGVATKDNSVDKASVTFDHLQSGYVLKSVHQWGKIASSVMPLTGSEK